MRREAEGRTLGVSEWKVHGWLSEAEAEACVTETRRIPRMQRLHVHVGNKIYLQIEGDVK